MRAIRQESRLWVDDAHAGCNATEVALVARPTDTAGIVATLAHAERHGLACSIAGARHAMGGQQWLDGGLLIDATGLCAIGDLDRDRGLVTVGAGATWPALWAWLIREQGDDPAPWTIRQKQTGADPLTLGGALAANIHGRGLTMRPFVDDVEAFELVDARGAVAWIDRGNDPDRFTLAIGGYGLFGVVTRIRLRLMRRRVLERQVQIVRAAQVVPTLEQAAAEGALYGDFQFSVDPSDDDFLDRGVLSCYLPVADGLRASRPPQLRRQDFHRLLALAHSDKRRAFALYAGHYMDTDGHRYDSDAQQFGFDLSGYHLAIDRERGHVGCELIIELSVPRPALPTLLARAATLCRRRDIEIVYGTVRLIRADHETRMPWAREHFACTVFNLHARKSKSGMARARADQQALTDLALELGGSFYLTYDRYYSRQQLLRAYPRTAEVLDAQRRLDPEGRFSSQFHRYLLELAG